MIGRRPQAAFGNSTGDRQMLEYTEAGAGSRLAVLLLHDDAQREYAYQSVAATLALSEPITTTARRQGWTVLSMRNDWSTVYADS